VVVVVERVTSVSMMMMERVTTTSARGKQERRHARLIQRGLGAAAVREPHAQGEDFGVQGALTAARVLREGAKRRHGGVALGRGALMRARKPRAQPPQGADRRQALGLWRGLG
jgi:hypothetical protein